MDGPICCPRCGHHNPSRARYCAYCGLHIAAGQANFVAGPAVRLPVPPQPRRHLGGGTVGVVLLLFAVVMGMYVVLRATAFVRRSHLGPIHIEQMNARPHIQHTVQERTIINESQWEIDPFDDG